MRKFEERENKQKKKKKEKMEEDKFEFENENPEFYKYILWEELSICCDSLLLFIYIII